MKPVDMTVLHNPESNQWGDCFRCCIASILELPASDVPHVMCGDDTTGKWYGLLLDWLQPQGLSYIEFHMDPKAPWNWDPKARIYHTLSGWSGRARHTVVALNGEMVHDPAPQKNGLEGPYNEPEWPDFGMYAVGLIVRTP